ncbi:UDP-N-acetylmuramoyl-tripeptide--D-alanyl-D-alanine ligase [Brevibacillus fulvus]|uniref:UDP-N-acetylmuramoyl-tripeptide--D-alanyl-D-alanine ligase n=1 Tax=Brevibacillus fulvus TaxID=1125967 RepID=A0A938Y0P1_9BACL|nr:UDP-N-acetylmuramoyl-tripeptide--D-alanyl-D-alanine ligase [Brevibacillus fulvus]MBM7590294.1 UDP-N-acetylmuramoyl-tripeptide--D-alanyl-D-alanine ligase [Brevibacillus fulvus]
MIRLTLRNVLRRINGTLTRGTGEEPITHATLNVDEIRKNTLFFEYPSSPVNWRKIAVPSSLIVITTDPLRILKAVGKKITIVRVKDVDRAYWDFVRYYRSLFDIPIIGITGTSGKTTTTEMVKHILSRHGRVQATYDGKNNLNNNLPYLLGIDERTEAAVFEMGVSHPGCITNSCRHFRPQVGVILNIGVYHLLGCKTFDNYLRAKAEMVDGVAPDGTLILNADDENIAKIDVSHFTGRLVRFGIKNEADYQAEAIQFTKKGMSFVLRHEDQSLEVQVNGFGEHNVYNAMAALASVHAIGVDLKDAAESLATFKQVRQHMEFVRGPKNTTVIDDTWNCTPLSMTAALQVLKAKAGEKRKVAILGYMPQLGEQAKGEYDRMAKVVMETGVDHLIVIGEAERIGRKAIQLGMNPRRIRYCKTGDDVYRALQPVLGRHSLVLCKFPYKYRLYKYPSFRKLRKWLIG